ncbi:hypothetical protein L3Q65_18350 [Amycolatopsis sp. FU40]|uniref:hypothetical protein n=1 Tax=Amycolatopsis sp. FU40 TaxID=2914159 RepID=UPI001F3D9C28|nr:hypothetical protein [Amycolatopsis sp. FU40]UKD58599.1 hypothetical protein L3Q65_18350 [Amycolatopsis sp. FU40]
MVAPVGLELLLDRWTTWSVFVSALALAVTVAFAGPPWQRALIRRAALDQLHQGLSYARRQLDELPERAGADPDEAEPTVAERRRKEIMNELAVIAAQQASLAVDVTVLLSELAGLSATEPSLEPPF